MSMISGLIDELNKSADEWNSSNMFELARMCRDAADTIWQLRDDLQRANAENTKLRERGAKTLEVGTRWMAKAARFESENTKLRELVALWIVIDKHMSLCATTDCGQCPVREECGESVYLEGLLGIDPKGLSWRVQERMAETADVQVENANLRELVHDMWPSYCYANSGCDTFLTDEQDAAIRERVRRLKVINK